MKAQFATFIYWISGYVLDIITQIKWTDFALPEDFAQQLEVDVILDVVKALIWFLMGLVYFKVIKWYNKRKLTNNEKTKQRS